MPPTPQPAAPLTTEALADRLVAAWPDYLAGVAAIGKPDAGWRSLDEIAKSGKCSRAWIDLHNAVTRAVFRRHAVPYHTPADRERLVAAWKLARLRLPTPPEATHGA